MDEDSVYRRIIANEAGVWASPARGLLLLGEAIYTLAVTLRNRRFDRIGPRSRPPVPVISVGNITVGGTGKTPFVIELVSRLQRLGRKPAVVARGYGAAPGEPGDEERLIHDHCPNVVYVGNSDRGRAAAIACERLGADAIVLDDAFQHRQIARDLDIVLIDATCPFGYGHVLPRGLLREPVAGLRRADVIALTRCDQVSADRLSEIEKQVGGMIGDAPVLKCRHRVTSIARLTGEPLEGPPHEVLAGRRAVLFAGIARPEAFVRTVEGLGIEVVGRRWWPDHHHYRLEDLRTLLDGTGCPPHDVLLTTDKDGVKLSRLHGLDPAKILVVKVAIDFVGDDGTMLQSILTRTLDRG